MRGSMCTVTATVSFKNKQTMIHIDKAWRFNAIVKKKYFCELVFFQNLGSLLFNFGTFALCCWEVKKWLQFEQNKLSKQCLEMKSRRKVSAVVYSNRSSHSWGAMIFCNVTLCRSTISFSLVPFIDLQSYFFLSKFVSTLSVPC